MDYCTELADGGEYEEVILENPTKEALLRNSCVQRINDRYFVAYTAPGEGREELLRLGGSIPALYGTMGEFEEGYVESGSREVAGPPLMLQGEGVVIAIVDSGIRLKDERFIGEDGRSRIVSVWDQTAVGVPPEGFHFGAEYDAQSIAEGVANVTDELGHGTELAAIAGGGTASFSGAARRAEFLIVKLREAQESLKRFYLVPSERVAYAESDIMLGVSYVVDYATKTGKQVVLCIGLGTNQGDHSGQLPLAQYLNDVSKIRGVTVVICGGNEGNAAHHYRGELLRVDYGQPNFYTDFSDRVEIRVEEGSPGFCMELWGLAPDVYSVRVQSPGGEQTPWIGFTRNRRQSYSFIYEPSSVELMNVLSEGNSGEELIFFRFENPSAGIWTVEVTCVEAPRIGVFHLWLPITEFLNREVYFLKPNPYITLTEPSTAPDPICVSTFDPVGNRFYIRSGRGYTRIGGVNPQISAPGVGISTGRGTLTGASAAAALTSGVLAQFLEWAVVRENMPGITSSQLRSLLVRGAVRDREVFYPSREWGYGRIDIEGVFRVLASS